MRKKHIRWRIVPLSLACCLSAVMLVGLLLAIRPAQAQESLSTVSLAAVSPSLVWPLSGSTTPDSSISSPFGPRWQASQARYDYHSGLDIAAPQDTPVHVITDGVVMEVGWLSLDSGLSVVVYHPALNLYSAYLHLNSTAMIVTAVVTQGQVIGAVGNSGTTEFNHLHFEIRLTANNYPASTRNPMGYLPRPEVTTPTLAIVSLSTEPIYSPTVSLVITGSRAELDVNQIRVTLRDKATGVLLDDQLVDFNQRLNTGADTLDQNGIQLVPAQFNTSTVSYVLTSTFSTLHGYDSFTLTAQVIDLAGHAFVIDTVANDTTPPAQTTSLTARRRADGGLDLAWVAPGDSQNVGCAAAYQVRYAASFINNVTWASAAVLPNPPTPACATLWQGWTLPGPFSEPVHFAIKTVDAEGNWSSLSNSARAFWLAFLPALFSR